MRRYAGHPCAQYSCLNGYALGRIPLRVDFFVNPCNKPAHHRKRKQQKSATTPANFPSVASNPPLLRRFHIMRRAPGVRARPRAWPWLRFGSEGVNSLGHRLIEFAAKRRVDDALQFVRGSTFPIVKGYTRHTAVLTTNGPERQLNFHFNSQPPKNPHCTRLKSFEKHL